jgi:flagellar assembly factor FliW
MKIATKFFGTVDVPEDQVILFDNRLPGFPDEDQFVLLPHQDESPFIFMQSVKTAGTAFVLTDPFRFFPGYEFSLPDSAKLQLEVEDTSQLQVWSIVVLRRILAESTINLKAPLIINTAKRKGQQLILETDRYSVRQPLFSPEAKAIPSADKPAVKKVGRK